MRIIFRSIVIIALAVILAVLIFFLCIYTGLTGKLPAEKELRSEQSSAASEVWSADSVLLGRYFIQDRTNVAYQDISENVIHALIATEDARFYEHSGVDVKSLLRVFFKTLLFRDESAGGGSTLSQQLAKNLYPRKHYRFLSTAVNKIREMIIANRLESVYSKEDILELYLNTVPMGGNIYGIERAAERFFGKPAASLKTEEAALLIGMLKANTAYNPVRYPDRAVERRNVVIGQMVKYGFLPVRIADSLQALPLRLDYRQNNSANGLAPYFREQLRLELVKWCQSQAKPDGEPYNLYTDGLKIYTTIDSRIQKHAERAVRNQMARLQQLFDQHWKGREPWGANKSVIRTAVQRSLRYNRLKQAGKTEAEIQEIFNKPVPVKLFTWGGIKQVTISPLDSVRYYQRMLNTGLLSMEPATGYVKAWVGGINYAVFKYDHVLSRRQAGSTFKPVVYAAALEKGIDPCRYFENRRITWPEFENWSPQNSDGQYSGKYTMRGALAHSVNTISAQLIMRTGIRQVIAQARRMGIESDIPEVPSIALGTADLSLFEMVRAYSVFAGKGVAVSPTYIRSIADRDNRILYRHTHTTGRRAVSPQNAMIMTEMLKGVVEEGNASRLRTGFGLKMDVAGKTGTTQNQADGWFIGITPDLVTGVWVGAENPAVHFRTLKLGSGANTALPVWANFMVDLTGQSAFSSFRNSRFTPLPDDLKTRLDCPSFIPDEPEEVKPEKKDPFFKRIFKKGLNLFKKKKKE